MHLRGCIIISSISVEKIDRFYGPDSKNQNGPPDNIKTRDTYKLKELVKTLYLSTLYAARFFYTLITVPFDQNP